MLPIQSLPSLAGLDQEGRELLRHRIRLEHGMRIGRFCGFPHSLSQALPQVFLRAPQSLEMSLMLQAVNVCHDLNDGGVCSC